MMLTSMSVYKNAILLFKPIYKIGCILHDQMEWFSTFRFYRSQSLQRAKVAYSNYSNDYENLNSWLSRMPNYEPRETDDIRQVETKLRNQRVSFELPIPKIIVAGGLNLNHLPKLCLKCTESAVWHCKKGIRPEQCFKKCTALSAISQGMIILMY